MGTKLKFRFGCALQLQNTKTKFELTDKFWENAQRIISSNPDVSAFRVRAKRDALYGISIFKVGVQVQVVKISRSSGSHH